MIEPSPHADRWRQLAAPAMLTVTVLIWASNNIATKLVLTEVSAPTLMLVRFTLMTLLFHFPTFLLMRHFGVRLSRGEWKRLGMAAILGNALSPLLFTIGISMTTATYASLILMTGPLWTAVLERVAFGTPVGSIQAIGMGIAFAGALYLGTGGTLEGAEAGMLLGGLLMTTANATWAGYILLTKPILSRRLPLAVMSSTNLVALPFVWPLIGLLGDVGELGGAQTWSWETWLGIIYLIVVAGVLSQVLFMYALRAVSASQAMAFTYLMPVFTAFFAAIFLDERVTLATLVCGTLIVFGLWLVNKTKPRPPHREPPEALAAAKDG